MAKDKEPKEKCPKCGSTIFAKATDKSGKLYCQAKGCGNVWVPGMDNMSRSDLVIRQAQTENRELKEELTRVRKENAHLREKLKQLEPNVPAEEDLFS